MSSAVRPVRRGRAAVRRLIAMISSLRRGNVVRPWSRFSFFTQGPDHDPGDRLTGARGKLAGQALGFGVADVQAMIEI
jgi:hypothetical protein